MTSLLYVFSLTGLSYLILTLLSKYNCAYGLDSGTEPVNAENFTVGTETIEDAKDPDKTPPLLTERPGRLDWYCLNVSDIEYDFHITYWGKISIGTPFYFETTLNNDNILRLVNGNFTCFTVVLVQGTYSFNPRCIIKVLSAHSNQGNFRVTLDTRDEYFDSYDIFEGECNYNEFDVIVVTRAVICIRTVTTVPETSRLGSERLTSAVITRDDSLLVDRCK